MNQENPTPQKGYPFRWVLPLQHMANVKIVEVLWRNSTVRDKWKYTNVHSELDTSHFRLMCDSLEENVDKLLVPPAIKDELKVFVIEMVRIALNWLKNVSRELKEIRVDEHYLAIIAHFIDNFSWDNNGLTDGRKMFQSYISNKETITSSIWRILCEYCIEDDIIRFSKTIDWRNCFLCSSTHAVYWYWRIYGKCPSKEMFVFDLHHSSFEDAYYRSGQFDEKKLIERLLEDSAGICSFLVGISAVKYFRNQPEHGALLDELLRRRGTSFSCESFVYILEHMKDTERIKQICSSNTHLHPLFRFSTSWPWNIFADRWINVFEDSSVLPQQFEDFFRSLFRSISGWRGFKLRGSQYKIICNRTVYPPFKEVRAFLERKFGVCDYELRRAFIEIFEMDDITFCGILLGDVGPTQRISFLRSLGDPAENPRFNGLYKQDSYDKFLEEVLKSDEERDIFRKIVSSCHRLDYQLNKNIK